MPHGPDLPTRAVVVNPDPLHTNMGDGADPEEYFDWLAQDTGPSFVFGVDAYEHPGKRLNRVLYPTDPRGTRTPSVPSSVSGGCAQNAHPNTAKRPTRRHPPSTIEEYRMEAALHRKPIPTRPLRGIRTPQSMTEIIEKNLPRLATNGMDSTSERRAWRNGSRPETKRFIDSTNRRKGDEPAPMVENDFKAHMKGPFMGGREPLRFPYVRCKCKEVQKVTHPHPIRKDSVLSVALKTDNIIRLSETLVDAGLAHPPTHPLPVLSGTLRNKPCPCSIIGPSLFVEYARWIGEVWNQYHIESLADPVTFLRKLRTAFTKDLGQRAVRHAYRQEQVDFIRRNAYRHWTQHERDNVDSLVRERDLHREAREGGGDREHDTIGVAWQDRGFTEDERSNFREKGFDV